MKCTHLLCVALVTFFFSGAAVSQKPKPNVYFFVQPDSFMAIGKWAATSSDPKDRISMPQEVEIDCFKSTQTCVEATAEYYSGHAHVNVAYTSVVKWDSNGIIISDSNGICMSRTILVNFSDQTIMVTHSLKELPEKQRELQILWRRSDSVLRARREGNGAMEEGVLGNTQIGKCVLADDPRHGGWRR
jgi:hypothetical protein